MTAFMLGILCLILGDIATELTKIRKTMQNPDNKEDDAA